MSMSRCGHDGNGAFEGGDDRVELVGAGFLNSVSKIHSGHSSNHIDIRTMISGLAWHVVRPVREDEHQTLLRL